MAFSFISQAKSAEGMKAARTMAAKHAMRCAKVVALAVLGSDFLIAKPGKHGILFAKFDVVCLPIRRVV